jgi:hypothetical protein
VSEAVMLQACELVGGDCKVPGTDRVVSLPRIGNAAIVAEQAADTEALAVTGH